MIMIVAFGTFTPTSTTDVATRISISPRENSLITVSFSFGFILPWRIPTRYFGNIFSCNCFASSLHRFYLKRTDFIWVGLIDSRTDDICLSARFNFFLLPHKPRLFPRESPRASFGIFLPGGISSRSVRSRSPYIVSASVRGSALPS